MADTCNILTVSVFGKKKNVFGFKTVDKMFIFSTLHMYGVWQLRFWSQNVFFFFFLTEKDSFKNKFFKVYYATGENQIE